MLLLTMKLLNQGLVLIKLKSSLRCRIYHCAQVCLSTGSLWPGGGDIFLPQFFYDGCLLMWCNFKFEGVLFQSDFRHTSFRAQVRGLITELAQGLICLKSGTAFFHHDLSPTMISHRIINTIYPIGATSRAGTAFLSGAPQLIHGSYWSSCCSIDIFLFTSSSLFFLQSYYCLLI